jgi:hypothetical protein
LRRKLFSSPSVDQAKEFAMAKPPKTPPHSDLEGVHQDERSNVDVAAELGQSAEDVEHAREKSKGRAPPDEPAKRRH